MELLFYGGLAVAIGSLIAAAVYFCISKIRAARLDAQLDREYGEE